MSTIHTLHFLRPMLFFLLIQLAWGQYSIYGKLLSLPLLLLLWFSFKKFPQRENPGAQQVLVALALTLGLWRCAQVVTKIHTPPAHLEDIATLNIAAATALFKHHQNPYTAQLDPYPVQRLGVTKIFAGYKYPPLGLYLYAPWTLLFGQRGILLANALAYALILLTLVWCLKQTALGPWWAVIALTSCDWFFTLCFNKGTNDFYPVLLTLWCLISHQRSSSRWGPLRTGVLLGLALATKQLPAAVLALIFFFQGAFRPLFIALITGSFLALPFLIASPLAFLDHLLIFPLTRPVRETSLQMLLPPLLQKASTLVGVAAIALCARWELKHPFNPSLSGRCWCYLLATTTFLLTAKMAPTHYFVWVLPVLVILCFAPAPRPRG